jgi:hypothetical protein
MQPENDLGLTVEYWVMKPTNFKEEQNTSFT